MTADCDDDGYAGFKGGYHSPVIHKSLAAVLGVTTLGTQQPVAGDPAALLSQFGLEGRVALACPAPQSLDRGHCRWRRPQREVLARHRGGPYSALD